MGNFQLQLAYGPWPLLYPNTGEALESSREKKSWKSKKHLEKKPFDLKWKWKNTNGKIWSDWHRTEQDGEALLMACVSHLYHWLKQVIIAKCPRIEPKDWFYKRKKLPENQKANVTLL